MPLMPGKPTASGPSTGQPGLMADAQGAAPPQQQTQYTNSLGEPVQERAHGVEAWTQNPGQGNPNNPGGMPDSHYKHATGLPPGTMLVNGNVVKDPNSTYQPPIQHGEPGYDKSKDPRGNYTQDLSRHHSDAYWHAYYGSKERFNRIKQEMYQATRSRANEFDAIAGNATWNGSHYVRPGETPDDQRDWGPAAGWEERVKGIDNNPPPRWSGATPPGPQGAAPGLMASAQGAAPPPATAQAAAPGLSRIDRWKSLGEQDQAGVAALIESSGLAKPGLIASWAKGELDANIMKTLDDLFARYMESRG